MLSGCLYEIYHRVTKIKKERRKEGIYFYPVPFDARERKKKKKETYDKIETLPVTPRYAIHLDRFTKNELLNENEFTIPDWQLLNGIHAKRSTQRFSVSRTFVFLNDDGCNRSNLTRVQCFKRVNITRRRSERRFASHPFPSTVYLCCTTLTAITGELSLLTSY